MAATERRQGKIRTQIITAMEAIDKPITPEEIQQSGYCTGTLTAIYTAIGAMQRERIIARVENAYYLRTERNAKRLADAVDRSGGKTARSFA